MKNLTYTDIEQLDKEISLVNNQMEVEKTIFINQLKNGLGDDIINHLNKQQKISCYQRFKQSIGYYFKMFFKMFG